MTSRRIFRHIDPDDGAGETAQPEPVSEAWVLTRGAYDSTRIVGVVDSKAEADAAVESTRWLSALDDDSLAAHGPFRLGEILSRDDAYRL